MRQSRAKAKTVVQKRGKERVMKGRKKAASLAPPKVPLEPEEHPMYEPDEEEFDLSSVVVDVEEARTPRSDLAMVIASNAKGQDAIESIKNRRNGPGLVHELNPYDVYLKPGWNLRNFDTAKRRRSIASLAVSIANHGMRETLIAHFDGDKITIHSGWNRMLAVWHAINVLNREIRTVPVRFERHPHSDADRVLSQIVNNTQDPLTPYEQGKVYKMLRNMGWEVADIAEKVGRTVGNIHILLDLQALPSEVQKLIDAGTVTAYFAAREYKRSGENTEETMLALNTAIANARAEGLDHAMPKHLLPAEQRRKTGRRSGTSTRGGGVRSTKTSAPPAQPELESESLSPQSDMVVNIPRIIEILRSARVEIEQEENTAIMWFPLTVFNDLAILAEIPDPDENEILNAGAASDDDNADDSTAEIIRINQGEESEPDDDENTSSAESASE